MSSGQQIDPAIGHRTFSSRWAYPMMALVMAAIALPLWVFTIALERQHQLSSASWPMALALSAAFVVSELMPLRIEVRRETVLLSLTEIPLAIGLVDHIPAEVVGLANLVPALVVYLVRRDSWRYVVLNLALVAAEIGVAVFIFSLTLRYLPAPGWTYLALVVGIPLGAILSSLGVGMTHRLLGPAEPLRKLVLRPLVASCATTTFGLVGWTLWTIGIPGSPMAGPLLCVGLAVAMVVLYRIYAQFLQQHLDLSKMYDFGRYVAGVGPAEADWQALLERVRDQLNAQIATVHLIEPVEGIRTLSIGPEGTVELVEPPPDDPLWRLAARDGRVHVAEDQTSSNSVLQAALAAREARDVLAVPLRSGDRNRGFLEVRDRRSRWGRFSPNDLQLLETLGQHMATALDNLGLLDTLRHEAHHDAITGLLNWRGLMIRTDAALKADTVSAVLLLQLGILPEVNNAIGHDRGEQLLSAAGDRLSAALGGGRTVAHLESDRFAVLVESVPRAEVEQVALSLLDEVGSTYSLNGIDVEPHARAGFAYVGPESGEADGASALLQRAEMALTAAQASDVPIRSYGPSMGEVFRRRFQLVTQFRRAVEEGRITVHYQPKVSLADQELVGVEALVRWTHPEFGPVSPAEFVEAIEATGSIDILLEHVLEIVLDQIQAWRARNMRISVAVNLSVRNLSAPDFPARVARALADRDIPPELLTFEITESSVMADPERSLPVLQALHDLGIKLSVDDFGTGYSSLAYLRRLPIDEIKIDKSFVQGMITDLGDLAIVRAIIDLGHSLQLRVVAEGVEEDAARDSLRRLRCDDLQGFLLSRPLPIQTLEAWFTSRTTRSRTDGGDSQVLRLMVG